MAELKWYEALRFRRRQLDLTQHELSKIARVDRTIIANIEAGRRKLSNDGIAERLWEALRRTAKERGLKFAGKELRKVTPAESGAEKTSYAKIYEEALEKYQQQFAAALQQEGGLFHYTTLRVLCEGKADRLFLSELLVSTRKEKDNRERQVSALENLKQSVDDPIVSELMESFRREIEEKDKEIELLSTELAKANTDE